MEAPTVSGLASQLQQFEENLSSSLWTCVSDVERLFQQFQQFKENVFFHIHTELPAFFCSRETVPVAHTMCNPVVLYAQPEEDMRKWDGESTWTLEDWIWELQ